MKKISYFLAIVLIIRFLANCRKDNPIPPTIVKGQVIEQGSNKPLEGVKVVLMEGTFGNSSGNYSYHPIDTFLTDKSGNFTYEHKLPQTLKDYELWYYKNNYFDISSKSNNVRITNITESKTISPIIRMSPFAWLRIRAINSNPFDEFDAFSIKVTDKDWDFYGIKVDETFIEKVQGGKKQAFSWIIQRNQKWGKTFVDSVYCKGRDTTYYEIKY